MASLIDKLVSSSSSSSMIKSGEGRERPKNWMKSPVFYRSEQKFDLTALATALSSYCAQEKLTIEQDTPLSGFKIAKLVMRVSRWECVLTANNDKGTELIFQVLSWFDNAANEVAIYKLISLIERTLVRVAPDTIVIEVNTQNKLTDLYKR